MDVCVPSATVRENLGRGYGLRTVCFRRRVVGHGFPKGARQIEPKEIRCRESDGLDAFSGLRQGLTVGKSDRQKSSSVFPHEESVAAPDGENVALDEMPAHFGEFAWPDMNDVPKPRRGEWVLEGRVDDLDAALAPCLDVGPDEHAVGAVMWQPNADDLDFCVDQIVERNGGLANIRHGDINGDSVVPDDDVVPVGVILVFEDFRDKTVESNKVEVVHPRRNASGVRWPRLWRVAPLVNGNLLSLNGPLPVAVVNVSVTVDGDDVAESGGWFRNALKDEAA